MAIHSRVVSVSVAFKCTYLHHVVGYIIILLDILLYDVSCLLLLVAYWCMYIGDVDNLLSLCSSPLFSYIFVSDIEDHLGFGTGQ